LILDWSGFKGV